MLCYIQCESATVLNILVRYPKLPSFVYSSSKVYSRSKEKKGLKCSVNKIAKLQFFVKFQNPTDRGLWLLFLTPRHHFDILRPVPEGPVLHHHLKSPCIPFKKFDEMMGTWWSSYMFVGRVIIVRNIWTVSLSHKCWLIMSNIRWVLNFLRTLNRPDCVSAI